MARYSDTVTNTKVGGPAYPIIGALIAVRNQSGATPTLYADDGITVLANPLTSNEYGVYYFNAPADFYDLTYIYGGRTIFERVGVAVGVVSLASGSVADSMGSGTTIAPSQRAVSQAVATLQAQINTLGGPIYYSNAAALTNGTTGTFVRVAQSGFYATDTYAKISSTALLYAPGFTFPAGLGIAVADQITVGMSAPYIQSPVTCIVSLDPVYARFWDGRFVPQSYPGTATHNVFLGVAGATVPGGGTFTPNYAVDTDGIAIHRIQLSAHGHILYLCAPFSGQVEGTILLKSKAGAGAQSCKAGIDSALDIYALTEGAWTTASFSKVATAGDNFSVWNNADALPLDILIKDNIQLYKDSEQPPVTEPSRKHMLVSRLGLAVPGTLTFGAAANSLAAPFDGIIDLRDDAGNVPTFTAMTVVQAIKQTGHNAGGDFAGCLFTPVSTGITYYSLRLGTYGDALDLGIAGLPTAGASADSLGQGWYGGSIYGQEWAVLSARFGPTYASLHLDNVTIAELAGSYSSLTIPQLWAGGQGYQNTAPFHGLTGPIRIADTQLSDADLTQMNQHVKERVTQFTGGAIAKTYWLDMEGDSITFYNSVNNYSRLTATAIALYPRYLNYAVGGSTLATLMGTTRWARYLKRMTEAVAYGSQPIASVLIGANGLPLISDMLTYCNSILATGAHLVVQTPTFRTAGFTQAAWTQYCIDLAVMVATLGPNATLCDYRTDTIMGDPTKVSDTSWYSDGLHWTDALHARAEVIHEAAVRSMMF